VISPKEIPEPVPAAAEVQPLSIEPKPSSELENETDKKEILPSQESESLDQELNVINKIYDRFYVQQKLPTKRKSSRVRTKYQRYIPRNPLMRKFINREDEPPKYTEEEVSQLQSPFPNHPSFRNSSMKTSKRSINKD